METATHTEHRNLPIDLSVFESNRDMDIERRSTTWGNLTGALANPKHERARKQDCRLLKLARYGDQPNPRGKGALRWNGNVEALSGLVAEHDAGKMSTGEAAELLAAKGIEAFLYTSPSHTPEAPRWRVMVPFFEPKSPDEHDHYMDLLNGILRGALAPESWTLSQIYYFGKVEGSTYETRHVPGECIDVVELLGEIDPLAKPSRKKRKPASEREVRAEPAAGIDDQIVADLRSALDWICEHAGDTSYSAWVEIGIALHSLPGDVGFGLWIEFSERFGEPDLEEAGRKWESGELAGESDYRHVFTVAQACGWINPGPGSVASDDEFENLGEATPSKGPLHGYYAFLPQHQYLDRKTRQLLPAASIDGHFRGIKINQLKPSSWLDKYRAVHQMTWDPGREELIDGQIVEAGGWSSAPGKRCYNTYRPAPEITSNAADVSPWLDHIERVYPDEHAHLVRWLAHRVQRPGEKINHALVLGGAQGIGKDTILEPVKSAIGHWNWSEISPAQMLGQWNDWVRAVVLRVSEARDLGDTDRFKFYDHSKSYIASPPDVLRVDEKHMRQYYVRNVMGVIITTNHKTDGIHLEPDDRRHFVAWSPLQRDDFDEAYWNELWRWYEDGGMQDVAAYLHKVDLSEFDAKAPPPKTEAFHAIVQANVAPEDVALGGLLHHLGLPHAVTLDDLRNATEVPGIDDDDELLMLFDRKARRRVPHALDRAGYVAVNNQDAKDGLWAVGGKRQAVYARRDLVPHERVRAVRGLTK